jgi:hypothetical protein
MDDQQRDQKKHRAKQSGRSVEKKQKQAKKNERRNNPKVFISSDGIVNGDNPLIGIYLCVRIECK